MNRRTVTGTAFQAMLFSPEVPDGTIPTLADVRAACLRNRGNVTYRANAVKAVDAAASRLGLSAQVIDVDLDKLRYDLVLQTVLVDERDGNQLWHNLRLAIRMSCLLPIMATRRAPKPCQPWIDLIAAISPLLGPSGKLHLNMFVASALICRLTPPDIEERHLASWTKGLGWIRDPNVAAMVEREMRTAWNEVGKQQATFGLRQVVAAKDDRSYLLPWHAFPASLKDEIEVALAFTQTPVGKEALLPPEDATRLNGVNGTTTDHYRRRLKASASAFVRGGGSPHELTSLQVILSWEGFAKVVHGHLSRGVDRLTFDSAENCRVLILIGKTACRIGEEAAENLAKQLEVLPDRSLDLHSDRVELLANLDRPTIRPVFAALPKILFDAASGPLKVTALSNMQSALLIDLARSAPLEPGFWQELRWDIHVSVNTAKGQAGTLFMSRAETGKALDFDYIIPAETADRLRQYRRHRGSQAGPGCFVFANRAGKLNSQSALNTMLRLSVRDFVDLPLCLTDLRFLSLFVFLKKNPHNLEGARQIAGLNSPGPLVPLSEFLLQSASPRTPQAPAAGLKGS